LAGAHLICLVTTAMTGSWAAVERRTVAIMVHEHENWCAESLILDVDMSKQEVVHGLVPISSQVHCDRTQPQLASYPVLLKTAIGETETTGRVHALQKLCEFIAYPL
jgi:hypothetical protein